MGLRVEHPQSLINKSQYGMEDPGGLGAASYRLAAKTIRAQMGPGLIQYALLCAKPHQSFQHRVVPALPVLHQRVQLKAPIIIVGAGPAGLFCCYFLALHGYRPLLLERGKCVEDRQKDVEIFWETGRLDPASNVQFGEGGAPGTAAAPSLPPAPPPPEYSCRIDPAFSWRPRNGAES